MKTALIAFLVAISLGASPTTKPTALKLPIIGTLLGREIALAHLKTNEDYAGFVGKTGETHSLDRLADYPSTIAMQFSVDNGRISKIIAYIRKPLPANEEAAAKRLEVSDPRAAVVREEVPGGKGGALWRLTFTLNAIEFYISEHAVSPEIADAIRSGVWVKGMTADDQKIVNDGPGVYDVRVAEKDDGVRGTVAVDPFFTNFDGAIHYSPKATSRADAISQVEGRIDTKKEQVLSCILTEPSP